MRNILTLLALLLCMVSHAYAQSEIDRMLDLESKMTEKKYIKEQIKETQKKLKNKISEEQKTIAKINKEDGFSELKEIKVIDEYHLFTIPRSLLTKYIGINASNENIFFLIKEMHEIIYDKGYITSSIIIKSYDSQTGTLVLMVKPGLIYDIVFLDQKDIPKDKIESVFNSAFPFAKGRVFNIKNIDQAVDNAKKYGYELFIDVLPGKEDASSTLSVGMQKTRNFIGSIGVNNNAESYEDTKGRYSFNAMFGKYNVLLPLDKISLMLNAKYFDDYPDDKENGYTLSYGAAYGKYEGSLSINRIETSSLLTTWIGQYKSKGNSTKFSIDNAYSLYRDKTGKLIAHITLNKKYSKSYVRDTLVAVTSKPYGDYSLALEYSDGIFGGALYSKLEYNKGASWLGGEPTACSNATDLCYYNKYHNKFNLRLSWNKVFEWISYSLDSDIQYSDNSMLSQYKMSIGDTYTVRGFSSQDSISGDSGFYVNNTFNILPLVVNFSGGAIYPFMGLDYGAVYNKDHFGDGEIGSMSLGTSISYKSFSFTPFISKPIVGESQNRFLIDIVASYSF